MTELHFAMNVAPEYQLLFRAKLGEPPPEAPPHLVLYDTESKSKAVELVLQLLSKFPSVQAAKLPMTVPTLLASRVITVSWRSLRQTASDGWAFSIQHAAVERILETLCHRAHRRIRQPGEFEHVINKLSRKHMMRKRTLRTMYGQIWRSLYPGEPLYPRWRKRPYPWWKHLKRGDTA